MKKNSFANHPAEKLVGVTSVEELACFLLELIYAWDRSDLLSRGKAAAALQCKYVGGTIPFGFSVDPKTRKYTVQEDEAENVRLVYTMIASGAELDIALRYLKKVGAKTRCGNDFSRTSLLNLLKNDRYNGVYTYNIHGSIDKQIRIPGGMPRIVDERVFNAVQSELQGIK